MPQLQTLPLDAGEDKILTELLASGGYLGILDMQQPTKLLAEGKL